MLRFRDSAGKRKSFNSGSARQKATGDVSSANKTLCTALPLLCYRLLEAKVRAGLKTEERPSAANSAWWRTAQFVCYHWLKRI